MSEIKVTAQNFEQVVSGEKPVLIDFWASWCGPCRMLAPVFEELSQKYDGQAIFVKIDVDDEECEVAAIKYGITSIPNIIAFKNGVPVDNSLGFVPQQVLEAFVEKNL